jgi:hypothetical protein
MDRIRESEDPGYYDSSLLSFNIPEFVTGEVKLNAREVEKKALSGEMIQMKSLSRTVSINPDIEPL